ncbi:Ig-like domain-containing protein [Pararhizobium sp. BT-229]|uniref:Ig-like domain-containing protein n=1 Tax=Pararhizobium sp. BT-229 TaxID=2986923 RepID=UPI0021F7AF98|nr:Ig-like domain-containing protein [Pararhizobium sp. BT-229]MCV9967615.1 Ig-like domain-containing protein [Pararhizobium sp. BT-229]
MARGRKGLIVIAAALLAATGWTAIVSRDLTAPAVSGLMPLPDAVEVDLNAAITATFSEDVDPATIGVNSLRLSAKGVPVKASVSYDTWTRSAVLAPAMPLKSRTKYTATIAAGAGDKAGNTLGTGQSWSFTTRRDLEHGFGGPVLIVHSGALPFSKYYSEILRAEGIGSFESMDLSHVTAELLGRFNLVLLGEMPLSEAQAAMFSRWAYTGGDLIAMRPDKKLAGLLGLEGQAASLNEGYLLIDTATAPGHGIVGETIQYHGAADLYALTEGTTEIARLYSNASNATPNPAVTIRTVGTAGGQAAAFTYDLARSVIYTRQGNPAWVGDERDGNSVIRPNDLFFGAKEGDKQPDWNDFQRIAIPVADEQQRLLVNVMNFMLEDKAPLPRLWYFPKGHKAVLVMASDDHGSRSGTEDSFDRLKANEPEGCSLAEWECYRATSWIYTSGGLSAREARAYIAEGFDIGVHVNTGCENFLPMDFARMFSHDLYAFRAQYPGLPPQTGSRTHCLAWSDWASTPKAEARYGVRIDLSYYYWPGPWVKNRPGFKTGSGLPMRFADLDGSMIDVYQVASHLVNESEMSFPSAIDIQLDRALGPLGYYGAFGTHYDFSDDFDSQLTTAAADRGVPLVSVQQLLDWTEGRNNSHFAHIEWSGNALTFDAFADRRTGTMLRGMIPAQTGGREVLAISRDGLPLDYETETIKGIVYAMFPVETGAYHVTYGQPQQVRD